MLTVNNDLLLLGVMLLTESIQVPFSEQLSYSCHLAKNLYNLANWYVRQDFFFMDTILTYQDLNYMLKNTVPYKSLPSNTSQQLLMLVMRNWKSYFNAVKKYRLAPFRFKAPPKLPKYKRKNGEYLLVFTYNQCRIKNGYLYFPKSTGLGPIKTRLQGKLKQVRILPLRIAYKIEIVYEKDVVDMHLDKDNLLSIDLGINNLITAVNNNGLHPFIIKGKVIKSMNHYYNKQLAYYRSIENKKGNFQDTKRMLRLHLKRNNKIRTLFHLISKRVIDYCKTWNIGVMVIGYNPGWKQNVVLGDKNNQNFVQVPFARLLQQLKYKGTLVGIQVVRQGEPYTSKCSFFDEEPIEKRDVYLGKRISRGLFRTANGTLVNADVNGAGNILRKAFPKASWGADGIQGVELHPMFWLMVKA